MNTRVLSYYICCSGQRVSVFICLAFMHLVVTFLSLWLYLLFLIALWLFIFVIRIYTKFLPRASLKRHILSKCASGAEKLLPLKWLYTWVRWVIVCRVVTWVHSCNAQLTFRLWCPGVLLLLPMRCPLFHLQITCCTVQSVILYYLFNM